MVALLAHPETRLPVLWAPRALPAPRVLRVLRDRPGLRVLRDRMALRVLRVSALALLLPLPAFLE